MPAETRYFRSDQHTVNGLTAEKLLTAQSAAAQFFNRLEVGLLDGHWGIKVWKRSQAGIETRLDAGGDFPVAQVHRLVPPGIVPPGAQAEGIQSATWNCPQTYLDITDAIVVRVYQALGAPGVVANWHLCEDWITDQAQNWTNIGCRLNAATWTIHYYTWIQWAGFPPFIPWQTNGRFYWGDAAHDSRITNFNWEYPFVWLDWIPVRVDYTEVVPVTPDQFPFYLNFARRAMSLCLRFSAATLESEYESLIQEYILRGYNEEVLNQVLDIVNEKCAIIKGG